MQKITALLVSFDKMVLRTLLLRPFLLCLLAGAASALALPPFGVFPILFFTLPILYRALLGTNVKQAFARGWGFSFGFLVCGLYWIASSMLVDLAAFWWAIPLAVVGLPFYLSLYTGLAAAGFAVLQRRLIATPARVIALCVLLSIADIGRGTIFTGFPWNMMGQSWQHVLPMLQSVSLFGIYGLTLLTYFIMLIPVLLTDRNTVARRLAAIIIFVAFALIIWGSWRLHDATDAKVEDVQLRLVQPNIAQSLKVDPEAYARNFEQTLGLTSIPAIIRPTHIIWPEAAVPFLLTQNEEARLEIGARTPAKGITILGAPWRTFNEDGEKVYSNALVTVDPIGAIRHQYDKFHLVPFGEYFPWRKFLTDNFGASINAIAAGQYDFSAGPGPQSIALKGLPLVSPLICYEIIFSGAVTPSHTRAGWLLNVTNDAWFGSTTGPYQHFEIARLRAIEEGLPLVRVANTGISGIIDSYGRVMAKTQLNVTTSLDMGLPVSLPPTPFSKLKHLPYLLFLIGSSLAALRLRRSA